MLARSSLGENIGNVTGIGMWIVCTVTMS
ncbi:hypothetical protein SVAN01_08474 [Stagonosporopsis vannaccii]|nr:hypothetical protein SVAN01_08474 [Stagonosporopsis vannaccii]